MSKLIKLLILFALCQFTFFVGPTFAEEWVASKLRGAVYVYKDARWQQIYRGYLVDSANAIQTAPRSRVVFTRGKETIDVRADTRIRIKDRSGQLNTVIEQDFGEITVDVEKQNVQHFAVQATMLTAVVKGTKFTVRSDKSGVATEVQVHRGRVEVQDRERRVKVNIRSRQKAERFNNADSVVEVKGIGIVEPIYSMNTNVPIAANSEDLKVLLGLAPEKINRHNSNDKRDRDKDARDNEGSNSSPPSEEEPVSEDTGSTDSDDVGSDDGGTPSGGGDEDDTGSDDHGSTIGSGGEDDEPDDNENSNIIEEILDSVGSAVGGDDDDDDDDD